MGWKEILKKDEEIEKSASAIFSRMSEKIKQEVRKLVNAGTSFNDAVLRVYGKIMPKKETTKPKVSPSRPRNISGPIDRRSRF